MKRSRLYLATLTLLAGAAAAAGLLLAPAPQVDALPTFRCGPERTTAAVSGAGPTCAAALQDAEARAAALVSCGDSCSEVFEVTQQCIGRGSCNPTCNTEYVVTGRMRYRCRVEL